MTVRIVPAREPEHIPGHVLWSLTKDVRVAEARVRMVAAGPELRVYVTDRQSGAFDLRFSTVLRDGREVQELALQKEREFEVRGWTEDAEAKAKRLFGDQDLPVQG